MKKELLLEGMKCDGCVATVKEKFSAIAGVEEVIVDLEENKFVHFFCLAIVVNTI